MMPQRYLRGSRLSARPTSDARLTSRLACDLPARHKHSLGDAQAATCHQLDELDHRNPTRVAARIGADTGEIEQRISHIRGRGDHEQAASLEGWLREVELGFSDRILPITFPVAS